MDLAKIRQKARQELADRLREETPSNEMEVGESIPVSKGASWNPPAVVEDLLQDLFPVTDSMPLPAVLPEYAAAPARRQLQRDPLEIILAGRVAAGCYEDQPPAAGQIETVVDEYQEFLCFRVSEEIYGINIMDIKEIIKPREVTEVPRAPSFVSGIISLRGIIIPIIEMLDRLGLPREKVSGRERVIVVRHGESFSGLLVDEIIQVVRIAKDSLEAAPAVLEGIDRDFVSGIGRADGRMIILLNLENIANIHLY